MLHETLRDETFAQSLRETADPDWENLDAESDHPEATNLPPNAAPQTSLFANLELYVQTLRELLQSREIEPSDSHSLRRARERYFPLLDEDEWDLVQKQVGLDTGRNC